MRMKRVAMGWAWVALGAATAGGCDDAAGQAEPAAGAPQDGGDAACPPRPYTGHFCRDDQAGLMCAGEVACLCGFDLDSGVNVATPCECKLVDGFGWEFVCADDCSAACTDGGGPDVPPPPPEEPEAPGCDDLCAHMASAACAPMPTELCVSGCEQQRVAGCEETLDAFLACAVEAALTCVPGFPIPTVEGCDDTSDALDACLDAR